MVWGNRTARDKNPLQMKVPFALWKLGMIRERFGVRFSEVSKGRILRNLGFKPQRSLRRAYQQNAALVEQWRAEEYPRIRRLAQQEKALIFFADEAVIRSDCHKGHTWKPAAKTSVVSASEARFSLYMLSAVNARGHYRLMLHADSVTAETFCTFLQRLVGGVEQKIFLIVTSHRIHLAKKVPTLLKKKMKGKITLSILTRYSPDLNPDELIWSQVKRRVGRQTVRSKADLKNRVLTALRSLQKMPEKIRRLFRTPACRSGMQA